MTFIHWFPCHCMQLVFSHIFGKWDNQVFTTHIYYRLHMQSLSYRLVLYWYRWASFQRNPHKHHHSVENGVYLLHRWIVFLFFSQSAPITAMPRNMKIFDGFWLVRNFEFRTCRHTRKTQENSVNSVKESIRARRKLYKPFC